MAKLEAHVKRSIAAKPKLVQITTAYGKLAEGTDKGEIRKVCANPDCPIHHAKKPKQSRDAQWKADEHKRQCEEAIAQATGLRVLSAIADAVPVRLMKRDLQFVVERMAVMLDERRVQIVCRLHSIKKAQDADSLPKLLTAFIRKSDESTLGRLLVELAILQSARSDTNAALVLRGAAQQYKVDIEAITAKVKQEFAAKERAKATKKAEAKPQAKPAKKSSAA